MLPVLTNESSRDISVVCAPTVLEARTGGRGSKIPEDAKTGPPPVLLRAPKLLLPTGWDCGRWWGELAEISASTVEFGEKLVWTERGGASALVAHVTAALSPTMPPG